MAEHRPLWEIHSPQFLMVFDFAEEIGGLSSVSVSGFKEICDIAVKFFTI
jgi:hypothetical protein